MPLYHFWNRSLSCLVCMNFIMEKGMPHVRDSGVRGVTLTMTWHSGTHQGIISLEYRTIFQEGSEFFVFFSSVWNIAANHSR